MSSYTTYSPSIYSGVLNSNCFLGSSIQFRLTIIEIVPIKKVREIYYTVYQILLVSPREWVGKGVDDHSRMGGGCTNCKRPPKKPSRFIAPQSPLFVTECVQRVRNQFRVLNKEI